MPKSTVASKRGVVDVARELESIRSYYLAVKDKIAQQPEFVHPSIELLYTEINKLSSRSLEVSLKVCALFWLFSRFHFEVNCLFVVFFRCQKTKAR